MVCAITLLHGGAGLVPERFVEKDKEDDWTECGGCLLVVILQLALAPVISFLPV